MKEEKVNNNAKGAYVMDRERVVSHLQIINTWATVDLRSPKEPIWSYRTLEDVKQWTDDAIALLKEQEHGGTFTVIDTKTGKEADEYEIALQMSVDNMLMKIEKGLRRFVMPDREKVIKGLEIQLDDLQKYSDSYEMLTLTQEQAKDIIALLKEHDEVKPVPPDDEFSLYRCGKCYHQLFRCVDKYCSRCGSPVKWE